MIIVQGISFASNLKGVAAHPIQLSVDNKLVYSAHVYDHQISVFHFDTFENTYESFNTMFNFINNASMDYGAPIFIGEFAGTTVSSNYWQFLMKYLHDAEIHWGYWSVNSATAGDGDTHNSGIMSTDWLTVT